MKYLAHIASVIGHLNCAYAACTSANAVLVLWSENLAEN